MNRFSANLRALNHVFFFSPFNIGFTLKKNALNFNRGNLSKCFVADTLMRRTISMTESHTAHQNSNCKHAISHINDSKNEQNKTKNREQRNVQPTTTSNCVWGIFITEFMSKIKHNHQKYYKSSINDYAIACGLSIAPIQKLHALQYFSSGTLFFIVWFVSSFFYLNCCYCWFLFL